MFEHLVSHQSRRARRCLAYSLHELGKILGHGIAEKDLLPAFEKFLRDVDSVRVGVLSNLANFLAELTPGTRESLLPHLIAIRNNSKLKWRYRHLLAQQTAKLASLFTPPATYSVVLELTENLLRDSVFDVRQAAANAMGPLLLRLGGANEEWQVML